MSITKKIKTGFDNLDKRFLILSLIYILLFICFKNRFDYKEYGRHWLFIFNGGNPWDHASNSYGPLHSVFSGLYVVHAKLPRLIFGILATYTSYQLWCLLRDKTKIKESLKKQLFYLIFLNPILWYFIIVNGCNDGFVASVFILGLIKYDNKKYTLAALLISLGILYKYIPIFIL